MVNPTLGRWAGCRQCRSGATPRPVCTPRSPVSPTWSMLALEGHFASCVVGNVLHIAPCHVCNHHAELYASLSTWAGPRAQCHWPAANGRVRLGCCTARLVPCPYAAQSTLTTKVDPVVELPLSHQAVCAGEVGYHTFHAQKVMLTAGRHCTHQLFQRSASPSQRCGEVAAVGTQGFTAGGESHVIQGWD